MTKQKGIYIFLISLLMVTTNVFTGKSADLETPDISAKKDSLKSGKKKKSDKNFRFSILGGPGYTPDYGLVIGGSTLFTFRMNRSDTLQKRSVTPIAFALTAGGFNFVSRPQLFFKDDRFRIFGQFLYKNNKDNFYGVGYNTNETYVRGKETSAYTSSEIQINPQFLFRIKNSNFFAGPFLDITYSEMKKPSVGVIDNPSYIAQGGDSTGYFNFSSGLGLSVSYDTRDMPANTYHGLYLDFKTAFYNKILGSQTNFYQLNLDYRQYLPVGKRRTLAWSVQSRNMLGNVPLTRLVLTGSPFDLRGYYLGQYRDKTSHIAIAEYRHMINTPCDTRWQRLINRLGFAAWTGVGFMGPKITKIEGVLPNFGLGLRVEVQPRMNFRLDVGYNPINKQTLIYFNMTEAF